MCVYMYNGAFFRLSMLENPCVFLPPADPKIDPLELAPKLAAFGRLLVLRWMVGMGPWVDQLTEMYKIYGLLLS